MFTGLVEDLGTIEAVDATADGVRLTVSTRLASDVGPGDSVAVNGVCLTAIDPTPERVVFEVINESLRRSSLAGLAAGATVNLELALRADARLGGHIMQGHVDGLGAVSEIREDGFSKVIRIGTEPELLRYVVFKGSIAVNGVSLTVSAVGEDWFEISLIPETLERTTLGASPVGTPVNLEVDVLAKYVEKLVAR